MSLPKYERRMTGLRCNSCGHQFEDFAWHEAIQTNDQGDTPKGYPSPTKHERCLLSQYARRSQR